MKRICCAFSAWEVRTKLAAALAWLVCLLFVESIGLLWLLTAVILLFVAADGGMSLKKAVSQLLHVSPFILLMLVTLSLSSGWPIRADAVWFAVLLCSRVVTAVLIIVALVGGRTSDDFIRSLAVIPLPSVYLSLLFLVNRYVHLLTREFHQQTMALKSRMFVPKANFAVLKNIGYVVGGMFIRGYDRSEHVYDAMRARSYNGVIPFDDAPKPNIRDWLKLVLAILIIAGVIIAEKMV